MTYDLAGYSAALLCEFVYVGFNPATPAAGNVQVPIRITDSEEELEVDGVPYISDPDLRLKLPQFDGTMEDKEAELTFRYGNLAAFEQLMGNRSFPTMTVRIRKMSYDPKAATTHASHVMWQGTIDFGDLNAPNKEGLLTVTVGPCGGRVEEDVTPSITPLCWKKFGHAKTCGVSLPPIQETGTITAVAGRTLTVTGLTTPRTDHWHNGYVNLHGVDIKIVRWSRTQPTTFELAEFPAETFMDQALPQTATFTPGCARTPLACNYHQGDQLQFGSLGTQIPGRHPMYETTDD